MKTNDHPLSILARAPAERVKRFAEELLPKVGAIEVLQNRVGTTMVPYTDTAQGARFFVGEVLMAEARVRLSGSTVEGYGARAGRDAECALAMAVVDAALRAGIQRVEIESFIASESRSRHAADTELLTKVESTRVEMETF